jgi:DNA-binding ferritin-like protein
MFASMNEEVDDLIDRVGERIAGLDAVPAGTLQAVFERTTLAPFPPDGRSHDEIVDGVMTRTTVIAEWLRKAAARTSNDPPTQRLYFDALELVEHHRRRLLAHGDRRVDPMPRLMPPARA